MKLQHRPRRHAAVMLVASVFMCVVLLWTRFLSIPNFGRPAGGGSGGLVDGSRLLTDTKRIRDRGFEAGAFSSTHSSSNKRTTGKHVRDHSVTDATTDRTLRLMADDLADLVAQDVAVGSGQGHSQDATHGSARFSALSTLCVPAASLVSPIRAGDERETGPYCDAFFSHHTIGAGNRQVHVMRSSPSSNGGAKAKRVLKESGASEGKARDGTVFIDAIAPEGDLKSVVLNQGQAMQRLAVKQAPKLGAYPTDADVVFTESDVGGSCAVASGALSLDKLLTNGAKVDRDPDGNITIGVLVVSVGTVSAALSGQGNAMEALRALLHRAAVVYITLGWRDEVNSELPYMMLENLPGVLGEGFTPPRRLATACDVAPVGADLSRNVAAAALRVTCANVTETNSEVLLSPSCQKQLFLPSGAAAPSKESSSSASSLWHPSCAAMVKVPSSPAIRFKRSMKLGTKTAIYDGKIGATRKVWKQFNVAQYRSFRGFHALMSHPVRSPLIVYPNFSCFDRASSDSVFQPQPFVQAPNLKKFMANHRKGTSSELTWPARIAIAAQITCVLDFLHNHPSGVFTYDDNHPEQWLVAADESSLGGLRVSLIDIDTVQLAEPRTAEVSSARPRVLSSYSTVCRCFYCKGRSNCLFINTPEGYSGCGQDAEDAAETGGSKERPERVLSGRRCDATSDAWFLAQLLIYLVDGRGPIPDASMADVLQQIVGQSRFPEARSGDASYDALVEGLFRTRSDPRAVLDSLGKLSQKYGSSAAAVQCPATYTTDKPYLEALPNLWAAPS